MSFNRYQAFGTHLLGSVLVALCASALVLWVWYPGPMAVASGVTSVFLMMLGIDVILGPCITLVVFNPAKKELKRDLMIVLLLQIVALGYGLNAVFVARPVFAVFNADRFDLVYANDLTDEKLAKVIDERFKRPSLFGPEIIAARRPDSAKERNEIMFGALAGGDDVPQLPEYYVPYADKKADALARAQKIDDLRKFSQNDPAKIDALLAKYSARKAEIAYLPLKAKAQDLTVIVALDSAEVLEITDLTPW